MSSRIFLPHLSLSLVKIELDILMNLGTCTTYICLLSYVFHRGSWIDLIQTQSNIEFLILQKILSRCEGALGRIVNLVVVFWLTKLQWERKSSAEWYGMALIHGGSFVSWALGKALRYFRAVMT